MIKVSPAPSIVIDTLAGEKARQNNLSELYMSNNLIKKILGKKIVLFIVIAGLGFGGYYGYVSMFGKKDVVTYDTVTVETGMVIQSVSGTGQVSAETQLDVKPEVSAKVINVAVSGGQAVNAGDLLFKLDETEAQKTVRDAEVSLETAQLSLAKLQEPADELSVLQAENSLKTAKESAQTAEYDLNKAYTDGMSQVSSVFLDLPGVMTVLDDILYGSDSIVRQSSANYASYYVDAIKNYNSGAAKYGEDLAVAYTDAKARYDKNTQDYKSTTINSDKAAIETLVNETYATVKAVSEAVKAANNLVRLYDDTMTAQNLSSQSFADDHLTSLNTYTTEINADMTSLLSASNTIVSKKQSVVSANRSIREKEESLTDLLAGTDASDLRTQQLAVEQRQNDLADAKEQLDKYTITAPFPGIVASLDVKTGDSASSGSALATLITDKQIAEVSLNEVDAVKVKVGQAATMTFDAIDELSLTGKVSEVETLGTVSQGVVSYTATIVLDIQDVRVRPGMSVTASIITDSAADVLVVPNAAVKSNSAGYYIEVMNNGAVPVRQAVEIGLASDDYTEIKSGLKAGDNVVVATGTSSAKKATTSSFNLFGGGPR